MTLGFRLAWFIFHTPFAKAVFLVLKNFDSENLLYPIIFSTTPGNQSFIFFVRFYFQKVPIRILNSTTPHHVVFSVIPKVLFVFQKVD